MSARLAKGRKRAAMGIYRRERVWRIAYHEQNRRRIQESSHSSIRRDAERLHSLRKSEVLRGVYREPVRISLESFADRYMEYAKTNKRSWLRDEQLLKPLKEFFRVERQLADITPPEIEGLKLWRRKQVSGATVNRELALLKHMFNLAIDWDLYLCSNPFRKVKFFQEVNTVFRVLKPDEESAELLFCLTSSRAGSRHHDGEGTVGTLDGDRYDALHAFESHFEGGCRGKTGGRCYNSATPCTKMQQFESPL